MILQVRHVMKTHPFTVPHIVTVTKTAKTMIKAGIDAIVVTKNDELFGVVTTTDILRYTYTSGFNPAKTNIEAISQENIMLVRPTTSLDDVRTILTETEVNTLPVVDKELVGYITLRDILKVQPEKKAQVLP